MRKIVVKVISNKLIELFDKFRNLKGESSINKVRRDKIDSNKKQTALLKRFPSLKQAITSDNQSESKKFPKSTPSFIEQTLP